MIIRTVFLYVLTLGLCAANLMANDVYGVVSSASNAQCNNGSIDLVVAGGYAPYTFEWNGPNGFYATSEDINGLVPGDYTVTVYDDHCCVATLTLMVGCTQCISEIVVDGITPAFCGLQLGGVDIHISNTNVSSILYKWYRWNETSQSWNQINQFSSGSAGGDINGITASTYKVVAAFGACMLEKVVEVTSITEDFEADIQVINQVSECTPNPFVYQGYYTSSNDGAMCVSVVPQPSFPYTIEWYFNGSFIGSGLCKYDLPPGNYSFVANFGGGCVENLGEFQLCCCSNPTEYPSHPNIPFCSVPYEGTIPFTLVIKNIIIKAATNSTSEDGSITFGVDPPSSSYQYQWSPSLPNSATQTGLAAGQYCVTITNSCVSVSTQRCFTVPTCEENPMTINGEVTNTCPGYSAGSLTATASGGWPPYTYQWNTGQTGSGISNLAAGQYCVTVTNKFGCTAVRCFTVNSNQPFSVSGYTTNPCGTQYNCNGIPAYIAPYTGPLNCGYENCNEYTCRCPLTNGIVSVVNHSYVGYYVDWIDCEIEKLCRDGSIDYEEGITYRGYQPIAVQGCGLCYICVESTYCDIYGTVRIIAEAQVDGWNCGFVEDPFIGSWSDFSKIRLMDLFCSMRQDSLISDSSRLVLPIGVPSTISVEAYLTLVDSLKSVGMPTEVYFIDLSNCPDSSEVPVYEREMEKPHQLLGEAHDSTQQILVSPNPFTDHIQIYFSHLPVNGNMHIKVSNPVGQMVFEKISYDAAQHHNIMLKNLPSGPYYLEIVHNGALIHVQKLIKTQN